MRAYERLLKYVSIYTTSDPDSATVPSSMRQYDLARILVDELNALGLENVHVDENGIVYGVSETLFEPETAGLRRRARARLHRPYGYRAGLLRRKCKASDHRAL